MSKTIGTQQLTKTLHGLLTSLNRYRSLVFFVLLTSLYGYIVWRINVLSTAPPSQADVTTAAKSVPHPKISEETVQKLEGLQDNSVRVQALFSQARDNPFQE